MTRNIPVYLYTKASGIFESLVLFTEAKEITEWTATTQSDTLTCLSVCLPACHLYHSLTRGGALTVRLEDWLLSVPVGGDSTGTGRKHPIQCKSVTEVDEVAEFRQWVERRAMRRISDWSFFFFLKPLHENFWKIKWKYVFKKSWNRQENGLEVFLYFCVSADGHDAVNIEVTWPVPAVLHPKQCCVPIDRCRQTMRAWSTDWSGWL